MVKMIIGVLIVCLLLMAIKSKMVLNRMRQKDMVETISSPVSQAITQLVGMAGGIYLSLIMLVSFLSIDVADKVVYKSWSFDPLALFSLLITILQPTLQYLLRRFR